MRLVAVLTLVLVASTAQAKNGTGYVGGEKLSVRLTEINGKDVEIRTAKAFRLMQKAAHKHGVSLKIRSGFRTYKKQAKLYKQYRQGQGNLAAPPGFSNHESGRALDLYITDHDALAWLQKHAATYGFHRTVPGEAWHWEYLGDEDRSIARPATKRERKTS
jgi:LAS superfamily LD-carboxypeptidase LdcB